MLSRVPPNVRYWGPLINARTLISVPPFFVGASKHKGTRWRKRCDALDLAGSSDDALFWGHCIWSSMFEKAALSFSAFLISSALT
jgi:hypothetical protein